MPLLLVVAFLVLAAPAQAAITGPTAAKKVAVAAYEDTYGGGRSVLITDTRYRMLRFDGRTRRITRIAAPKGCSAHAWDGRRTFLVECGYDEIRTYRLLADTSRRTVRFPGVEPGDYFEEFGTRWACGRFIPEGGDERDDPHELCVNRRSGRRVVFTPQQEASCGRDLDREDLRSYERCTYDSYETWRSWRLDPENALLLWRKGGRKRILQKRCSYECDGRIVDGRVTWWTEAGRAGIVHLLDVRSGRRWRWRVSPIVPAGQDMFGDPVQELHTVPMDAGLLIFRGRRQRGDAIGPYDVSFVRWP